MLTDRGKILAQYWRRLRGDAILPVSEALKLEQLGGEVAACVYCEWDDAERLNILYAGATTVEELGIDASGRDLFEFSSTKNKDASRLLFAAVRDHPCGVLSTVTFQGVGAVPMLFEVLYLPVLHQGVASRLLISVAALSPDFRSGDVEGANQATDFTELSFIDLGAGTPEASGLLRSVKSCSLEQLAN